MNAIIYLNSIGFTELIYTAYLIINNINTATAITSVTGAAAMSATCALAISYSGSLFFSTIENYIPNTLPKTKAVIGIIKVVLSLPVQITELTSNSIFGVGEKIITGHKLPTNITSTFQLDKGPKLSNLPELKKPVGEFLYTLGQKHFRNSFPPH